MTTGDSAGRRVIATRRRWGVAGLLAALHLALALLLLRPAPPILPAPVPATSPVLVATAVPAPVPAVPVAPPPPAFTPITTVTAAPVFEIATDAGNAGKAATAPPGGCAMTDHIAASLGGDARVASALARIPSAARTVANVVTVWSGGWADPRSLGGNAVLDPLRAGIVAAIASAPPACRAEVVTGPRFVLASPADGGAPLVLAFGSGDWRWEQLAD